MAGLAALWTIIALGFMVYAIYAAVKGSKLGFLNTRNKAIIVAVVSPFIWFIGTGILAVNDHSTPKLPPPPPENSIAGLMASVNQVDTVNNNIKTYNFSTEYALNSFMKQDQALSSAKIEKSIDKDGSNCDAASVLSGEMWICGINGKVSEVHYRYVDTKPINTDKIATVFMDIFYDSESPYTTTDKARILREFKEYANEKPPFQFPNRWIAINGNFVRVERLIGTKKSGFELNTNPNDAP